MYQFPQNLDPYTDKYFLRAREILQKEKLNPFVRAQIFVRKGPGFVNGITEVYELLRQRSDFFKNHGQVLSLKDGQQYEGNETIMVLEGRAQDVIPLETILLGIVSSETTKASDGDTIDLEDISKKARAIVDAVAGRAVMYFGARHWRYDMDAQIAQAAFAGGARDASTDVGAQVQGKKGVGTIPHALECIFAAKYGLDKTVVETTKAFDRHIDSTVPRIALVDFANREIDDALSVAHALGPKLYGVRVDTCGENTMQGAEIVHSHADAYWYGTGVTISGVSALRKALDANGFEKVKIVLSSGFGDLEKVRAFMSAEKELSVRLFDSLGVGELFPARTATMDIVGVGETRENIVPLAKVGRSYQPNSRLQQII